MRAWAILLALASMGCDETPDTPTAEEAEALAGAARAEHEAQLRADPTTPEGCAEHLRGTTPPAVAWTLGALGYDDLWSDTCATEAALRERAPDLCDGIRSRLVQDACRTRLAVTVERPTFCPITPRGRDPLCVALASRRLALCQGAPLLEREACYELLGDVSHGCSNSVSPELCAGIVARHRAIVDSLDAAREAPPTTELHVSFERLVRGQPAVALGPLESLDAFDRGAVLHRLAGRVELALADPLGMSIASSGRTTVELHVPLANDPGGRDEGLQVSIGPTAARLEVRHSELGVLRVTEGTVSLRRLRRELGGVVEGSFEGRASSSTGEVRVHGSFTTFVRDIELDEEGR